MIMRLLLIVILVFCNYFCYSQTFSPPVSDKVGDKYYEGIKNYSNVSTGKMKLKSFLKVYEILEVNNFKMNFFIPNYLANKELEVYVQDNKDQNYYMIPIQDKWSQGTHIFEWDKNRLADKHKITAKDLIGYVKSKQDIRKFYLVPIGINSSDDTFLYQWIFIANQNSGLKYTILNSKRDTIAGPIKILNQLKGQDITFNWSSKNYVQGEYTLMLEYVFTTSTGQVTKGQDVYGFIHNISR